MLPQLTSLSWPSWDVGTPRRLGRWGETPPPQVNMAEAIHGVTLNPH